MRTPLVLLLAAGSFVAGCKSEPFTPDAKIDAPLDAFQPPWWTPEKGAYKNWDIQLVAPFDTSTPRALYVLDLWAVTPAQTIMYDDGSTVSVPAGAIAGAVDALHATTPKTMVACHLRGGSVNLVKDPDAMKFPGYEASPPNNPNAPAANSVIGWRVLGKTADERYLDIRAGSRARFAEIIQKRVELADELGCDAVVFDGDDRYQANDGWGEVPFEDEGSWHLQVKDYAHAATAGAGRRDSAAMAAGVHQGYLRGLVDSLAAQDNYDLTVTERCTEFGECDFLRPYLNLRKPVFAIEYRPDGQGGGIDPGVACQELANKGIEDGLAKDVPLNASFAMPCP